MIYLRHITTAITLGGVLLLSSLAEAGDLGPAFLEGRLVGGSAHDFHLAPLQSPDHSGYQGHASDIWRFGSEGGFESRLLFDVNYRYDEWDWNLQSLSWQGDLRPVDEAVVRWDWRLANSWFAFDGGAEGWSHGFEEPYPMELRQKTFFSYLQRQGRIRVERPFYPLLFYRNPVVNQKQHRWSLLESHAFGTAGILADSLGVGWGYGLTNSLELSASFLAGRTAVLGEDWEVTPWENRTDLKITAFWGPLRTEWGVVLGLWSPESGGQKRRDFDVAADLVLFGAKRVFSEVAGNWDGLFDRTAPPGQLLLSAQATSWTTRQGWSDGPDSLRLGFLWGLPFGLAIDGGVLNSDKWVGGAGISWLSVPLRTGGPERAQSMEILYGWVPSAGGQFIHADLWDDNILWGGFDWLFGLPAGHFLIVEGVWNFDSNAPAYLGGAWGWGNRHWRVQVGGERRWSAGVAASGPIWRSDRDNHPACSLYERTLGEAPLFGEGWSLNLALRTWF